MIDTVYNPSVFTNGVARLLERHGVPQQLGISSLSLHPEVEETARQVARAPMMRATSATLKKYDELCKELRGAREALPRAQDELAELEGRRAYFILGKVKDRAHKLVEKRTEIEALRQLVNDLEYMRGQVEPMARNDLRAEAEEIGNQLGEGIRERRTEWEGRMLAFLREELRQIFGLVEEGRAIGRAIDRAIEDRLRGITE